MPQLILNPWFLIFLLSWLTLIFIFKSKTTQLAHENPPQKMEEHTQNLHNWTWPWP